MHEKRSGFGSPHLILDLDLEKRGKRYEIRSPPQGAGDKGETAEGEEER